MTNEKLEQCLAQALEKTAPHDVDGVLSRCEKRKGTEIPMKTKPHSLKKWMAMAACLALLLLCGGGLFLRQANAVASVVSIDVNPSIELRVNQNEKVLACVPMNDDAHAILADMGGGEDLKGAKLDVAVNAIVGSLVRNGYLESISSAIMISVEDRDRSPGSPTAAGPLRRRGRHPAGQRLSGLRIDPDGHAGHVSGEAGQGPPHLHRQGGAGEPYPRPEQQSVL